LGVVLCIAMVGRLRIIKGTLPYCQHVDEDIWMTRAIAMVKEGRLDPGRYFKSTLFAYSLAAPVAVAFVTNRKTTDPEALGTSGLPYYQMPRSARWARRLYAGLGVGAMFFASLIAAHVAADRRAWWLPAAVLALAGGFTGVSIIHLQVDILTTFCALFAVAYLLTWETSAVTKTVWGGVLIGIAVGSKFNMIPLLGTGLLYMLLFQPRRFPFLSILFVVAAMLGFALANPAIFFALGEVLGALAYNATHYAQGHDKFAVERGLGHLITDLGWFLKEFGWFGSLASLIGMGVLFRRDWRSAATLLSMPVLYVGYMSTQRVHFTRNLLAPTAFLAIFVAVGVLAVADLVWKKMKSWPRTRRHATAATVGLVVVAYVSLLPLDRLKANYAFRESRVLAARWLSDHFDRNTPIAVALRTGMDPRILRRRFSKVTVVDLVEEDHTIDSLKQKFEGHVLVTPVFGNPDRHARLGIFAVLATFGRGKVHDLTREQWEKLEDYRPFLNTTNPKLQLSKL
jgi:hypothetical protein